MKTDKLTFEEIIERLTPAMRTALLTDERAIEQLPFRERDELIILGLARRAWPSYTGDGQWRTWLTTLGVCLRTRLEPRHWSSEDAQGLGTVRDPDVASGTVGSKGAEDAFG